MGEGIGKDISNSGESKRKRRNQEEGKMVERTKLELGKDGWERNNERRNEGQTGYKIKEGGEEGMESGVGDGEREKGGR